MIKKLTVETQTYSIDWAEAYEAIKNYIYNKYGLDFGEQNFQIRAVSDTGVFVKPESIRFKRIGKPQEDTLCPNK
jgi:hypothetical protein